MKAKEYGDQYKANPTHETLLDIIDKMIREQNALIKLRKVERPKALMGILNESQNKWRAVVAHADLPESYVPIFKKVIFELFPEWKELESCLI